MKKIVAVFAVLILFLSTVSVAFAFTSWDSRIKEKNQTSMKYIERPDGKVMEVSASYAGGKYYSALQTVIEDAKTNPALTPEEYFIEIARSQLGYSGSTASKKYSGSPDEIGSYVEYTWDNIDWCASFVSWCARAAGFSDSVMPVGKGAGNWNNESSYRALWNSNFTKYNSDVDIQAGDIVTFFPSDYLGEKKDDGTYKKGRGEFTAYLFDHSGTKIKHTPVYDPKTKAYNCGKHYLSNTGTSHVAIVAEAIPLDKNNNPCDKSKAVAYEIVTIERHGNTVGSRHFITNSNVYIKGRNTPYSACTHVYGANKSIPAIKGRYRPNWSKAVMWKIQPDAPKDTEKPALDEINVTNLTATGFDLNLKATDNVAVTAYRIDVWANGERQYDMTLSTTAAQSSTQKYHFDWTKFKAGTNNVNYHVFAYPRDAAGNMGDSRAVWAYADGNGPGNVTAYTTNVTKDGYDLVVHAEDESGIASVRINIYGASIKRYDQWKDADGSKSYTGTYHFDFKKDYESFDGDTLYANYVYVKDGSGNTTEAIRANVFADASAPLVTAKGFEDENEDGFRVRYVVTDNDEIAEISVDLYLDGRFLETSVESIGGRKSYEGSFYYAYPMEADGEENYTARITACDAAGNETAAIDFGTSVVRAAADRLPADYFHSIENWNYVLEGNNFYITGPADPEACASVTRLLPSDFPTVITVDGVVYRFCGTRAAEDPAYGFCAMNKLREIVGFPETTQEVGGFEGCPALQKVDCTGYHVAPRAFAGCSSLSEVKLQKWISSIGEDAFSDCPNLTKLLYEGTPESWVYTDVAGQIPPVEYRVDVSAVCRADTSARKPGVITAIFTNNGWLGEKTYWTTNDGCCQVDFFDEAGNELGYYATSKLPLSFCGKTCTISLDLETMSWTYELAPATTYLYQVSLCCDGNLITSPKERFTTADADVNPIQYITLNYAGTTLAIGDTLWLYRYLHPGDARNRDVIWTSSNPSVVSVENGKITALAAGTAIITCEATDPLANGAKASCSVFVAEDCETCSTAYAGWYKIQGTSGQYVYSKHTGFASLGSTHVGKIPEGTVIWISKAMGYEGWQKGTGRDFGHTSYHGINGFVDMYNLVKVNGNTVTLDLNGGTAPDSFYRDTNGDPVLRVTLWEGGTTNNAVANRIPVRTGYTFRGWNNNAAGTGKMVYDASGMTKVDGTFWVEGDGGPAWGGIGITTLYAAWQPVQNTITFDPAGGMVSSFSQKMTYDSVSNNTAPVPVKAGYTFAGWYTDGGTQMFAADGKWNPGATWYFTKEGKWQRDMNVTVRAHWEIADTTPPVIRDVSVIDRSAKGYTVSFIAEDNIALAQAYIESWTVEEGEANAVRDTAILTGNHGVAWVNINDHLGTAGSQYITRIIVRDAVGNEDIRTLSGDSAVYVDARPPVVNSVSIQSFDEYGIVLTADVSDDESLEYIRCLIWPEGEDHPEDDAWYLADCFYTDEGANWSAFVSIPDSGVFRWNLAVRAEDASRNVSDEYMLTVDIEHTAPAEPLCYRVFDGHVYVLMSPVSRSRTGKDTEAVWQASQEYCEEMGGHLISLDSAEEKSFAASLADLYGGPVWIGKENTALCVDSTETNDAEKPDGLYGFICEIDKDILTLPPVREIHSHAFYGNAARIVVIPEKCETIGEEAFAAAQKLQYVLLPEERDIDIAEDAFGDVMYLDY